MEIVSFANVNHPGLLNLRNSIEKLGDWHHTILGENTEWKGWKTRMRAYRDHCASVDPNKVIILCDAFDVLCVRNGAEFQSTFDSILQSHENKVKQTDEIESNEHKEPNEFFEYNLETEPRIESQLESQLEPQLEPLQESKITIDKITNDKAAHKIIVGVEVGCDPNCFPPINYYHKKNINEWTVARRFLNGGLMAGHAGLLSKMWTWCLEKGFNDDQVALGHYTDSHHDDIILDLDSRLFFNDHLAETKYVFDTKTNHLVYENLILTPFLIHFPGINIEASIPFFNLFKTDELFQVGRNYKMIGNHINGSDKQMNVFPPDKRGLSLGVIIERSIYVGFSVILLFVAIFLFFRLARSRKKS